MKEVECIARRMSRACGFAFSALLAIALFAVHGAFAANTYYWEGSNNASFPQRLNWVDSNGANPSAHVNGQTEDNLWFQENKYNAKFTGTNNRTVKFATVVTNKWKVFIRDNGTESAPLVFDLNGNVSASCGLVAGNSTSSDVGFHIGDGVAGTEAWLKLAGGTYRTTKNGCWFVGNNNTANGVGHIVSCEGVTMSAEKNFEFRNGTLDATGTTLSCATFLAGCATGGGGTVAVTKDGGDWTIGTLKIATNRNVNATFEQKAGTLASTGNIEIGDFGDGNTGTALFDISGGTVTPSGNIHLGYSGVAGASSIMKVRGTAEVTLPDSRGIFVGNASAGRLEISDSASVQVGNYLAFGWQSTGDKVLDLGEDSALVLSGSGVLKTASIRAKDTNGGTSTITLDGGTLKVLDNANTYTTSTGNPFIPAFPKLFVKVTENGGTIDTSGCAITIAEDLESAVVDDAGTPDVVEADGGMTFTGGGTVTLSGGISYNGKTTLANGTALAVAQTAAKTKLLANGIVVVIPEGGIIDGAVVLTLQSGDTISAGELAAVSLNGTGTANYALELSADGKSVIVRNNTTEVLTWNGGASGDWSGTGLWRDENSVAKSWKSGDEAVFATAGDKATLSADATAKALTFQASATVDGTGTLSVPTVSVVPTVSATVSAPTAGALEKTGAGTLVLGASRTEQTTVAEGTLRMASGTTVDPAKFTLGTDPAKAVTFDYAGQTLSANSAAYLGTGTDVTLTNGTFASAGNIVFTGSSSPAALTIAKNAVLKTAARYGWNASQDAGVDSEVTINIAGGQMISEATDNNNWFMQNSRRGTLRINVSDGGLFQMGGLTYIMTGRDSTTANDTPAMYMAFNDSTFRVNNAHLRIGYDDNNKNPKEPKFSLAMTNSVLDVGTGIVYLGHNVAGENTAGFYTADIVNSVVTALHFSVYMDRPLNKANFDGSTIVASGSNDYYVEQQGWGAGVRGGITVGAGGLTLDTQAFTCGLRADLVGTGAVTKKGSGVLRVDVSQTGTGAFSVEEGTLALADGVTATRGLSLAADTTLVIGSLGTDKAAFTGSSFTFAPGATVILPSSLSKGENKLFTLTEGTFAADAAANLSVQCAFPCSLAVRDDTIYVSIEHDYTILNGTTKTAPVIRDDEHVIGAGGFNVANLALPATAKLTYDPVKTPIYVWTQLTVNEGFKFALSENYAGMTCGRIVLVTFKESGVTGLPETAEGLNALFDASTIASGARYAVTVEPAPANDNIGRQQLVLTVGDYANAPEIRILPIGDSITQGVTRDDQDDYPQYRTSIAARLAASGYRPKMRGVWKFACYNAAHVEEPDDWAWHCGISGDRISTARYSDSDQRGGVRDNLHLYLDIAGYTAVITLLIGTNDVGSGGEAGAVGYANFKTLVLDMAAKRPGAKIVVSTILQRNGEDDVKYQRVVDFNNLLKADMAAGNVYPSNVVLLDLFEQIPLDGEGNFFSDKLHMNWVGCSLAAEAFAGKIMEALPLPSFTGTTDATVTDEAQTALGATETVPAEYRAGMTHVFTIDAANAGNAFGTQGYAPYTETNTLVSLSRQVTKVGYYMELVRAGTSRRRYVWVDFDATGKTLDELDFPWTGDNIQFIADKLHVYSNDSGITNVAANVDSVKGIIEGTYHSYTAPSALSGAPADILTFGWNDTLGTDNAGFGCFQAHRIFSQAAGDTHWNDAQVLFAWNRWSASAATDEIGIGDYACHASGVGNTMDYTHTVNKGSDGLPDTVGAGAYQVRHLEIWAVPVIPQNAKHGKWIGGAGPEMSTPGNWEDNTVPVAGDALDFSAVTAATTVNADIDATFGAVTMGTGVVTFNGNLAATSFTDTSKIAVGENATVTLDGNLEIAGSGDAAYVVNRVGSGGSFIVTGRIIATSGFTGKNLYQCASCGGGTVVVKGLETHTNTSNDNWTFRLVGGENGTVKWAVGADGISGTKKFYLNKNAARTTEIQPTDGDFAVATWIGNRANLILNTTGTDGNAHTINISNGGGISRDGTLTIAGAGTVVADYDWTVGDGADSNGYCTMPISVTNTATLALTPGSNIISNNTISVASNATLQVAQSGTVALGGNLSLADGAILGFNLTDGDLSVLDVSDKTVTFGSESNVVIKVSVAPGRGAMVGSSVLTKGGKFKGVNVRLADDHPAWASSVSVNGDGNIVLDAEFKGLMIIFH